MESKKLLDLKDKCYVMYNPHYDVNVVMYKGVILWSTIYDNLDGCEVYLDQTDDEISICGTTPIEWMPNEYDFSTYGLWYKLEDALEWLENPRPLY